MSIREDLKAYLDGELDPARSQEIEQAIKADPEVRREVEELRMLGDGIQQFAAEPAVLGLEQTLAALTRPRPWWRIAPTQLALSGAFGMLLVVTVIGGVGYFMQPKIEHESAASASPRLALDYENDVTVQAPMAAAEGEVADRNARGDKKMSEGRSRSEHPGADALDLRDSDSQAFDSEGVQLKKPSSPPTELKLKVHDVGAARAQAESIAKNLGGSVARRQAADDETVVLEVPTKFLESAVEGIKGLENSQRRERDNLGGLDIDKGLSEQKADPTLEKHETRKDGPMSTIVAVFSPVEVVRDLSAPVQEPELETPWQVFMGAAVSVFTFLPVWLPLLLVGWWLTARVRRR